MPKGVLSPEGQKRKIEHLRIVCRTPEFRDKMRQLKIGKHPHPHLRPETKMQISIGLKRAYAEGRKKSYFAEHPYSRPLIDNPGYFGIHGWLKKTFGLANHCENNPEHNGPYEWAHIVKGEYKRDRNDYCHLCISCHRILDNSVANLKVNNWGNDNG